MGDLFLIFAQHLVNLLLHLFLNIGVCGQLPTNIACSTRGGVKSSKEKYSCLSSQIVITQFICKFSSLVGI